jgi:parallel beta-helix repeat protein
MFQKSIITIGIILIFMLSNICPTTSSDKANFDNIIYVDDDNADGPWDGSIEHPYQTINDGVIAAKEGDTVYVYSGIYGEGYTDKYACVKIDKRINLVGEDKYTTIIDANQPPNPAKMGVVLNTDGISIHGFTIRNAVWAGGGAGRGISIDYLKPYINNITIYDNILVNNDYGIINFDGNHCEIYNNIISNSEEAGIWLFSGGNCHIYENIISNNNIGIEVSSRDGTNIIEYNQIKDNKKGIYTTTNTPSTIRFNNIINNDVQTSFIKGNMLILIIIDPFSIFYNQRWDRNYWDDWKIGSPRPIKGELIIGISPLLIFSHEFKFPSFQFDWSPAKEPYNIT